MHLRRSDVADFIYFLAIARHRSFRSAGTELGVSASALSHALKGLETRLGVRLLNRTNRSVTLTAAGEQFHDAVLGPFEAIDRAVESINQLRDVPAGRIRINAIDDAASFLLGPVLATFNERYPDVEVELSVDNHLIDVIEQGFDAGIRFGGTVPADMVAQQVSPDFRWLVVGSPAYLERAGTPAHPNDLAHHRCLNVRLGDGRLYRWEFERDGEALSVAVSGLVTIDEAQVARTLAAAGAGLVYVAEPCVRPLVESGALRPVLEDWAVTGEGFQIYYSSRRQLPPGLRLLIELIKEVQPLGRTSSP